MCLILFAYRAHPDYPLILAANRDEFYARPSRHAHYWEDSPQILAGRDLLQGGTWLGLTQGGRFAAVTNVRNGIATTNPQLRSRGQLTRDYLSSDIEPAEFITRLCQEQQHYPGFNLLLGDGDSLYYHSNADGHLQCQPQPLPPGIYGLSNGRLNSPWPKLQRGKEALAQTLLHARPPTAALFALLRDRWQADDQSLPDTGVSLEWERKLAPCFIHTEDYGTRTSTLVMQHRQGGLELHEQNFDAQGPTLLQRFELQSATTA